MWKINYISRRAILLSSLFIILGCSEITSIFYKPKWDEPENIGVKNALLNAEQLVEMTFNTTNKLDLCYGKISAFSTITGMPYSSTRDEDLFCPNNVSFWTFYSALTNPNSYLYTKNLKEQPDSLTGLIGPYYGQVCTSFIQYALGIKYNFQIYQMTKWEGIENINTKEIDNLKLCDILTTQRGHTVLITGIQRSGNYVKAVQISESKPNYACKHIEDRHYIEKLLTEEDYEIYRYKFISETNHVSTPLINLNQNNNSVVLFNKHIMPRRGDMANWRKDENIEIDILDRGLYTNYKIYKDNTLLFNESLPINSNFINLGVMPSGNYRMCLSNNEEESECVHWIVVDYSISAEIIQAGRVKVSFSSDNAVPVWITWRRPNIPNTYNNNMPLWTDVIYSRDIINGYRMSNLDEYHLERYGTENWDIKVAFETAYGVITSDAVTLYNPNNISN